MRDFLMRPSRHRTEASEQPHAAARQSTLALHSCALRGAAPAQSPARALRNRSAVATTETISSEFSPCHAPSGPNSGTLQLWCNPRLAWKDLPCIEIGVTRSMRNAGTVTVKFDTASAEAGLDFAPRQRRNGVSAERPVS